MAKAIIIGEIKNSELSKVAKEMATKAKELGLETTGLLFNGDDSGAKEFGQAGVSTVILASASEYNGEAYAQCLAKVIQDKGFDFVFMAHSWMGRDVAGRLSALLGAGAISDIIEIKLSGESAEVKKPVYAGKAFVSLKSKANPQIFTVRPNAFDAADNPVEPAIEKAEVDLSNVKTRQTGFKETGGSKVALTEAGIIISGGRGIKGPEFFPHLQEIADLLGGALGASRATVDAGWIDHSHQVGQTGKTVSPNLYVAVGISGAIQHLAGMGSSKNIVAINKDPDAPIFKVATYGVVDDLFDVVPPFHDALKKLKG